MFKIVINPTSNPLPSTGVATCQGNGDPHYLSFDGRRFDFQGACRYTLVRAQGEGVAVPFAVVVENEYRNGVTRVSWLKEAEVSVFHPRLARDVRVVMNRNDGSKGQALVSARAVAGNVDGNAIESDT